MNLGYQFCCGRVQVQFSYPHLNSKWYFRGTKHLPVSGPSSIPCYSSSGEGPRSLLQGVSRLAQLIMRGLWYTMIIVSILFALNDHQREGKFQQTVNVMLLINNQDQFSSFPCLLAPKAQNFKAIVSDGFNMHFLFTVWSCQQIFHKVWTTNFPCMSVEACLISQNRNPLYV